MSDFLDYDPAEKSRDARDILKAQEAGIERHKETIAHLGRRLEAKDAEIERLRAVLEEFADTKHHNPPVPLWISMKARNALV